MLVSKTLFGVTETPEGTPWHKNSLLTTDGGFFSHGTLGHERGMSKGSWPSMPLTPRSKVRSFLQFWRISKPACYTVMRSCDGFSPRGDAAFPLRWSAGIALESVCEMGRPWCGNIPEKPPMAIKSTLLKSWTSATGRFNVIGFIGDGLGSSCCRRHGVPSRYDRIAYALGSNGRECATKCRMG